MRHIIIEGCDGSGKDTLIRQLMQVFDYRFELHERASSSLGGPVNNLAAWVSRDVNTMSMQPPSIYNRHPLISELIYHQFRQPPGFRSPEFGNRAWVQAMRREAAAHCVLVICKPPAHIVKNTVHEQGANAHMPGVFENISEIYKEYAKYVWPGITIKYDWYSPDTPYRLRDTPTGLAGQILDAFHFNETRNK